MQIRPATAPQAWHVLITPEMRKGYAFGIYRKLREFLPQRVAKQVNNETKLKEMALSIERQIYSGTKSQSDYTASFVVQGNSLIEVANTIFGGDFFASIVR